MMRGDKELYKYSKICEPSARNTSFDTEGRGTRLTRSVSTPRTWS